MHFSSQRRNRFGSLREFDSKPNSKTVKAQMITIGVMGYGQILLVRQLLCHGARVGFDSPSFEIVSMLSLAQNPNARFRHLVWTCDLSPKGDRRSAPDDFARLQSTSHSSAFKTR